MENDNNSTNIERYLSILERKIILMIDLNQLDDAITECKRGLQYINGISVNDFILQRYAALLANLGIAFESKYENEIESDKKNEYYSNALLFLKNSLKIWQSFDDLYNICAVKLHIADLNFAKNQDLKSYINKYKRIGKTVSILNEEKYQKIYAQILLQLVMLFSSTSEFSDCGINYYTAKKYLEKVADINERYRPNDIIAKMDYIKAGFSLELSTMGDADELIPIVTEYENLLVKYNEICAQDINEGMLELYTNDIQNNLGVACYRIGCWFVADNQFKEAEKYLVKAIKYFNDAINSYNKIEAQGSELLLKTQVNKANAIFILFRCNNDISLIKENIRELNRLIKKFINIMPSSLLIADAFIALGVSNNYLGKYELAIKNLNDAEIIILNGSDINEMAEDLYWLYKHYSTSYEALGKYETARDYIIKAKEILLHYEYELDSEEITELNNRISHLTIKIEK